MASSAPNPHCSPTSENVRSPLLRNATLRTANLGNCASSRRHSSPVKVVRMRSQVSASITSHKWPVVIDRKSTRLNSSHLGISYAVFCLKKKKKVIILTKYEQRALKVLHT